MYLKSDLFHSTALFIVRRLNNSFLSSWGSARSGIENTLEI